MRNLEKDISGCMNQSTSTNLLKGVGKVFRMDIPETEEFHPELNTVD